MDALLCVDVQNDFMNNDGALYVPGAEDIKLTIYKIIRLAWVADIPVLYTQDEHDGKEPEMKVNGGAFPFHCMFGTEGQKNIVEAPILDGKNQAITFKKACYDVFDEENGNTSFPEWLKMHNIKRVFVSGVALDFCVLAAVKGLLKMGIEVLLITDATKAVFADKVDAVLHDLELLGAKLITYVTYRGLVT
jgi:nicotinamidase/pyrazinamidase